MERQAADARLSGALALCTAQLIVQGIIMYLQSLPSATDWDEKATELLLAEAYVWKNTFSNTHHLATR